MCNWRAYLFLHRDIATWLCQSIGDIWTVEVVCKNACKLNEKFVHCDSCNRSMPAECSGLTASELRCMELKKRNLIFYWDDCKKKRGMNLKY